MAKRWRGFTETEELARRLRQRLGVDALLSPDLINLFQRLPEVFPGFLLVKVTDRELPDCEAKADCYEKRITVRESVYAACVMGEPRARMTLAHELAHIALGHAGTRYRQTNVLKERSTRDVNREEAEAKQFAAVFLVPTYLALSYKSIDDLCEKFGISREAAEIRLDQLASQEIPPSQRWHSMTKIPQQPSSGDNVTGNRVGGAEYQAAKRRRPLPSSAIDYLSEAKRRGRPITSLLDSDDA